MTVEALASGPIARVKQLRGAARYDAVLLQRKLLPGWQVAILRATASASASDAAPETAISRRTVEPSPSETISRARAAQTSPRSGRCWRRPSEADARLAWAAVSRHQAAWRWAGPRCSGGFGEG